MTGKIDLMIDSGAHSLYTYHMQNGQKRSKRMQDYEWSNTPEFKQYVDNYGKFIQEHQHLISTYVTVDVIYNPERSWEILKYLEETYGIRPMPVIHNGTDLKWLEKYVSEGYEYLGIGGFAQDVMSKAAYIEWADRAFDIICDQPSREPLAKVHGFAMISIDLMLRYPWYSVDATSWMMTAMYGSIYIPKFRGGAWHYKQNPTILAVSNRSPSTKLVGDHIDTVSPMERQQALDYIAEKGYVLGESRFEKRPQTHTRADNEFWAEKKPKDRNEDRLLEIVDVPGVSNNRWHRYEMNSMYFQDLEKVFPPWPWAYHRRARGRLL